MSCTCKNGNEKDLQFACRCDLFIHPPALHIDAGLNELPRQIAGFPEFRRAMLYALPGKEPLTSWKGRKTDDLGIMLLEMWAYVLDIVSFYDKVLAQEAYLRTAYQRASLRKLVGLLGYLPRPAIASTVYLAAFADGRQPVTLPLGTAFRSSAFDGNSPQVFELELTNTIHPLTNRWPVQAPTYGRLTTSNPDFLLIEPRTEIKPGALMLLVDSGNASQIQVAKVSNATPYNGIANRHYTKVQFQSALRATANTLLAGLELITPAHSVGLWAIQSSKASIITDGSRCSIALNNLFRNIRSGDYIVLSRLQECRWYQVVQVAEETYRQSVNDRVIVNGVTIDVPGISVLVTKLVLDTLLNDPVRKAGAAQDWTEEQRGELVVHYGMQTAGVIADVPKTTLATTDLKFIGQAEMPLEKNNPGVFLLVDKNQRGIKAGGHIDFLNNQLIINQGESWEPELTLPVDVFGNVLRASRGEQVRDEILGSGNASLPNQTFKLKKKPVTYLLSPTAENDQGIKSTLRVSVNSIQWTEVPGFYDKKPTDLIFIVRQNDEGDSLITFGDGVRGMRPSTGVNNITASYRFGAGAANPPAGAVNQIGKPVKGLQSVNNPLPASGGADKEPADKTRKYAPASALILGRAVSIKDMEAVTFSIPGVRAVQAEWRWHHVQQCPVVHIFYIGETGIEQSIFQRLRNVTDPSTPIRIEQAHALNTHLTIDFTYDPRYSETNVTDELREQLLNNRYGSLIPQKLGIGHPLFRSQLFAAVLSVQGIVAVKAVLWDNLFFEEFAKTPGTGHYFDFEQGGLSLHASI